MKKCSQCSQTITEGTFCPACGGQAVDVLEATPATAAPQAAPQAAPASGEGKSKLVAGLLGIFLGAWGVHRFYLGYTKMGVIQIVVTLVTCGVGAFWGLIEGILILCGKSITADSAGRPLTD